MGHGCTSCPEEVYLPQHSDLGLDIGGFARETRQDSLPDLLGEVAECWEDLPKPDEKGFLFISQIGRRMQRHQYGWENEAGHDAERYGLQLIRIHGQICHQWCGDGRRRHQMEDEEDGPDYRHSDGLEQETECGGTIPVNCLCSFGRVGFTYNEMVCHLFPLRKPSITVATQTAIP